MCLTSNTATSNNTSSTLMLPSPISGPDPISNDGGREVNEDDDCSIGVNDLADVKEGISITTGSQRTISPLSPRGEYDQGSFSLSLQAGSSLSKLDLLRARNREVRRRGSLKIAELRKSLNSSSGEILSPSPTKPKKKSVVMTLANDDATAVTVSSRTWTEPPTPTSTKELLGLRPPLEVDMKDNESTRSIRTFETLSSVNLNNFKERYKRLKHENELLRRQLTRLVEHHNDILRKERMNLRLELESRARASRNRLLMAIGLLVIGVVGRFIMNYSPNQTTTTTPTTTKVSLFSDEKEMPMPFHDVLVESNDRMNCATGDGALVADEIVSTLESRIEQDSPLGFILDTTLLEGPGTNNTEDTFHLDEGEAILLGETIVPKAKQIRRPGFFKRVLFDFRNNQMGIWLKHVKM